MGGQSVTSERKNIFDPILGGVLLEFHPSGGYVKVSAIDPVSLTEVSIVGDPNATKEVLTRTAARKLQFVMRKKFGKKTSDDEDNGNDPGPGLLV